MLSVKYGEDINHKLISNHLNSSMVNEVWHARAMAIFEVGLGVQSK